ncbi:type II and III secretion system protein [Phragmitibacter flavus]|uniref:Type II and III secretion system protein n=1 Tax=Phragmitibacter flavus TaxID=2576071 RepID=A0A5R8KH46_9BACT|nr:Amuc_1098 family type IV pilus outer membrane protein [Phragmitibacter flavus]TLD71571.1 type II and III secretion system protein [Phragmitibacter flavus]
MKHSALLILTAAIVATSAQAGSYGGPGGSTSGAAEREMARRMARVQEAQGAIERGDKLMADGDCEGALNEFKTALDLLPDAPMTAELREQVNHRFCAAAVCLARERAENGRYADARALLNEAIARHEECEDAKTLLEHLDDPERYEPALTPEHAANVSEVTRLLQMAYSYMNLGDYDNANTTFQGVLRIDKYNSAARRGMEQVELKRQNYFDTARDQRRAAMLNDVNKAWEDQVPTAIIQDPGDAYGSTIDDSAYYSQKMRNIIFPNVNFSGASIDEAIEFLRIKSRDFDTEERDPTKKGVNLILRQGAAPSTATISLDLKEVPMDEALRYITELANMKYKVEKFAVVVVPLSEVGDEQYTRTFLVPPDFLNSSAGGDPAAAAPADPFAPAGGGGGAAIAGRGTALDVLTASGIQFPEGASANFVSSTSQLIVRNTQPNLDAIEAFVDSLRKKVPQQIYITTKFVEVTQKNTDELGFDWLLGQFNIGGSARTFGGGGVSGNSANGSVSQTDFPFANGGTVIGQNPVTAGNRSGSIALTPDSIDGLLQAQSVASAIAPGVFSLAGVFTDPQFQLVIRALSQKKGVDLMSAPSVTCRSGQRAVIEVIREFIYPTEFDPPQIPQTIGATSGVGGDILGGGSAGSFPVTPTTPTAFDMRPVGVRMEVDPVLGPDGYTIDLNLAPEVTEFEGFINYGSPIQTGASDALGNPTTITLTENRIEQPIFSTRKVTTSVTIWDNQTVAIGGLIREDVQDVEDKVPLLGDIPILGRLFQSKAEDHFKRNLMIFVTAKLIDPSGQPVFRQKAPDTTAPIGPAPVSMDGGPGLLPAVNP